MAEANDITVKVKGGRKVIQDRYNAWMILVGLGLILAACVFESTLVSIAVGLFGVYAAGITGKAASFNWANTKEYTGKVTKALIVGLLSMGAVSANALMTGKVYEGQPVFFQPTLEEGLKEWKAIEVQHKAYVAAKVSNTALALDLALWNFTRCWLNNNRAWAYIDQPWNKFTKEGLQDAEEWLQGALDDARAGDPDRPRSECLACAKTVTKNLAFINARLAELGPD